MLHDEPAPFNVDEYLSAHGELPEPGACPYCEGEIREHRWEPISQRLTIERDDNGELEITDWHDYETHDGERDVHYSCASYEHLFDTLEQIDTEQREQHALRILMMSAPDHVWNESGDEPGTVLRLAAVYSAPMFAGRRARMARRERATMNDWLAWGRGTHYDRTRRWERFLALDGPPPNAADMSERELAAAGVL